MCTFSSRAMRVWSKIVKHVCPVNIHFLWYVFLAHQDCLGSTNGFKDFQLKMHLFDIWLF